MIPKKSYRCEYSSRLDHARTTSLLAAWHGAVAKDQLFSAASFNLDFHSVPCYGEDPQVERHYVSMRSRAQPSVLAFLAQDAEGRAFCESFRFHDVLLCELNSGGKNGTVKGPRGQLLPID